MDALDTKLNQHYEGRVVRKDLLHQIKKGTNVPSFVLEFLLAKFCASDDPEAVKAGKQAVIETLEQNYVRPDESNKAQSTVQREKRHRFIDKVHVRYVEKEKRHWAEMENFGSKRIAIAEKYYRENDRILEGGIWAEVTVAHNDIEDDDYAFLIEELKPIQLSRFELSHYLAGRQPFSRDEWIDAIIRTIGLEPAKMTKRLKFHYLARLFPFVEPNYNFIELGPRGTGKSYAFSEFSPYATLISGGQATTPILFYNNARERVGLVGFWDIVAFDEVAGIRIRDTDSVQIMKDYMANGRFSRGREVIANASLAFVGNIDYSVDQLVNSSYYDLFYPLPETFDLAVMDRFYNYLPGWEIPKNTSAALTPSYGFITDYLAEAFHHLFMHTNRYDWVNRNIRLGAAIEGRDEVAIKKTVCAFLKLLHPVGDPTPEELDEYVEYAVEGRRRVKEQMNKRKNDDEYRRINLSFFDSSKAERVVFCQESKGSQATLEPVRKVIQEAEAPVSRATGKSRIKTVVAKKVTKPPAPEATATPTAATAPVDSPAPGREVEPRERHYRILYGSTGHTYETIFGPYLTGVRRVEIDDPYMRNTHQLANFTRFCELLVKVDSVREVKLRTGFEDDRQKAEASEKLGQLGQSLVERDIKLSITFDMGLHDREVRLDNGWRIKIGRGLDFYQPPENWYAVGSQDMELRPCLETMVDVFRA